MNSVEKRTPLNDKLCMKTTIAIIQTSYFGRIGQNYGRANVHYYYYNFKMKIVIITLSDAFKLHLFFIRFESRTLNISNKCWLKSVYPNASDGEKVEWHKKVFHLKWKLLTDPKFEIYHCANGLKIDNYEISSWTSVHFPFI